MSDVTVSTPAKSPTGTTVTPAGGSVAQTTAVAMPLTGGIVFARWLMQPTWPPPDDVLIIALGVLAPVLHLIGREIMQRLTRWSESDDSKTPAVVVTPAPPPSN